MPMSSEPQCSTSQCGRSRSQNVAHCPRNHAQCCNMMRKIAERAPTPVPSRLGLQPGTLPQWPRPRSAKIGDLVQHGTSMSTCCSLVGHAATAQRLRARSAEIGEVFEHRKPLRAADVPSAPLLSGEERMKAAGKRRTHPSIGWGGVGADGMLTTAVAGVNSIRNANTIVPTEASYVATCCTMLRYIAPCLWSSQSQTLSCRAKLRSGARTHLTLISVKTHGLTSAPRPSMQVVT